MEQIEKTLNRQVGLRNYFLSKTNSAMRGLSQSGTYWWIGCWCLVYISSFYLSGRFTPSSGDLDESWQAVLEYAAQHNFQYGKDIVFTYGPLGYLYSNFGKGILIEQRVLFSLFLSGIVAWSVIGLARRMTGLWKFVFLSWFLLISYWGGPEVPVYLIMAFGSITILMEDLHQRKVSAAFFMIAAVLLSQIKFTFFILATGSIIICTLVQLFRRRLKDALLIPLCFTVTFLFVWLLIGQKTDNIWLWLRGSIEISSGYSESMAMFPQVNVLVMSVAAVLLFLAAVIVVTLKAPVVSTIGILCITTFYVFLSWKHGFVRADGHVFHFILFLPMAFCILFLERIQNNIPHKVKSAIFILFTSTVLACIVSANFQKGGVVRDGIIKWPGHLMDNCRLLANLVTGNSHACFQYLTGVSNPMVPDLPMVRSLIGNDAVDVFNYSQWAALVNNLNYRPRPVIQSYVVCTPYLQDMNLSFYRNDKRPPYVLLQMGPLIDHFVTLEDATALPYILNNYKPVAQESDFLVLKEAAQKQGDPVMTLVHEQVLSFGQKLNLSSWNKNFLFLQVEMNPTILGKVMKILFQSPNLILGAIANGKVNYFGFIPGMAKRGFMLNPLLEENRDVIDLYAGNLARLRIDEICFFKTPVALGQINNEIKVKLYRVDNFIFH